MHTPQAHLEPLAVHASLNPLLTTRRLWAGLRAAARDHVVLFSRKPRLSEHLRITVAAPTRKSAPFYDLRDPHNRELVVARIDLHDFREFFPAADLEPYTLRLPRRRHPRPPAPEIVTIFPLLLTAPFLPDGRPRSLLFHPLPEQP